MFRKFLVKEFESDKLLVTRHTRFYVDRYNDVNQWKIFPVNKHNNNKRLRGRKGHGIHNKT